MEMPRCRKCWQLIPPLDKRCPHCGDVDAGRFYDKVGELALYVAGFLTVVIGSLAIVRV
jgi:hypothetical protein